jgi:hypothetical protein
MKPAYAVLMGDIVDSENSPSLNAVHRAFNAAIDSANDKHVANIVSPLTITLGDEFQGLLTGLAHAWDAAADLSMKLMLAKISCRFVIGVAELETPLNTKKAWNMMGGGLSAARDKLNDKRPRNAYRFSLPNDWIMESLLDAVGETITQIEGAWTVTQLRYYAKSLGWQRTHAQLAKSLGVGSRSLYKVLRAARADFHKRQSKILRGALKGLDERYRLQ